MRTYGLVCSSCYRLFVSWDVHHGLRTNGEWTERQQTVQQAGRVGGVRGVHAGRGSEQAAPARLRSAQVRA